MDEWNDAKVMRYIADKNDPPLPAWPNPESMDAKRYRFLRDQAVRNAPANKRGEMVWCVIGKNAMECSPCEEAELDAAIDEAMLLMTPNVNSASRSKTLDQSE